MKNLPTVFWYYSPEQKKYNLKTVFARTISYHNHKCIHEVFLAIWKVNKMLMYLIKCSTDYKHFNCGQFIRPYQIIVVSFFLVYFRIGFKMFKVLLTGFTLWSASPLSQKKIISFYIVWFKNTTLKGQQFPH